MNHSFLERPPLRWWDLYFFVKRNEGEKVTVTIWHDSILHSFLERPPWGEAFIFRTTPFEVMRFVFSLWNKRNEGEGYCVSMWHDSILHSFRTTPFWCVNANKWRVKQKNRNPYWSWKVDVLLVFLTTWSERRRIVNLFKKATGTSENNENSRSTMDYLYCIPTLFLQYKRRQYNIRTQNTVLY